MRERRGRRCVRLGGTVAAATILMAGAGLGGARPTLAATPDSAHPTNEPAPNALTQPLVDGCQRNPTGMFSRNSPEWAYVYNTPPNQPPPAPHWVTGVVSANNPRYQAVHTSGGDLPFGHKAYDFNVNVLPDPGYVNLMGGSPTPTRTGNYAGGGEETNRLHTEWEDLSIPQFAWPEPGDHITELGSWVWDCGHWGTPTEIVNPDYILPKLGQPAAGCLVPTQVGPVIDPSQCKFTGEGTEFHPYRALWDVRTTSPASPTGEGEAELFVSTDKTLAGVEADCAHRFPATSAATYPPEYRACLQTEPVWQDVSGDYSFLLPAPPRPSPSATLTMRAVDRGSQGAPAPTLAAEGDAVRVTFHLATAPSQALAMAYSVYAGWDAGTAAPTHLHVTLDSLEIHRAMDPGCTVDAFGLPVPNCPYTAESIRTNQATAPPAKWNLTYDASGIWGRWTLNGNIELSVTEGQVLTGTQSLDLYVPPGGGWRFFVHGRECDLGALGVELDCPTDTGLSDDNDVQGSILDTYSSALASVGTHRSNGMTHKDDPTSTCPDVNPEGCYSLTYTVAVVGNPGTAAAESPTTALLALAGVGAVGSAAGWARRRRRRRARSG